MKYISNVIVFFIFFIFSCATNSVTNKEITNVMDKQTISEYMDKGYELGVVKYLESSSCGYIIEIKSKYPKKIFPIELEDTFKKSGLKVICKYSSLRRMSNCPNTIPVDVIDIKIY